MTSLSHRVMSHYVSGFHPIPSELLPRLMVDAHPLFKAAEFVEQGKELGKVSQPLVATAGARGKACVICLHGFTGNPYEVAPAVDAIAQYGCDAVAPLLPGHGYQHRAEQEQQFAQITPAAMLEAVRQEIAEARQRYCYVGLFGFSMGGAIALALAAEGLVDACAVAAPALRLPLLAEVLIPLLSWASFTREAPSKEPFYLPAYPFHHSKALRTLWQLSRKARQRLPQIQCPVLGLHSHGDATVPPIVLELMQRRIPAPIETVWFDPSGHVMLRDVNAPAVAITLAQFFVQRLEES